MYVYEPQPVYYVYAEVSPVHCTKSTVNLSITFNVNDVLVDGGTTKGEKEQKRQLDSRGVCMHVVTSTDIRGSMKYLDEWVDLRSHSSIGHCIVEVH